MKIAAVFFGLMAGLFALVAPVALKTDLMSPFLELWANNPSEHLLGTIVWYAIPAAALLGGLLAAMTPGFASLLLLAAAAGWVGVGLMLANLLDIQLIVPAAASGFSAALAFVAGELDLRQRRERRRTRRAATETLVDPGEFEREAALRMDPLVVPREEVAPPPKRAIPLTLDDVSVTEKPANPPPRWQDLDAPAAETRRGSDIWAEAIRPEPEPLPEPEPEPEPEPLPEPEPRAAQRRGGPGGRPGFNWDDEDVPVGQRRDPGPAPGPRLEPRRPEPAAGPRFEPRRPEPVPEPPAGPRFEPRRSEPVQEPRPEARRFEPPAPPRPEPRHPQAQRPTHRSDPDLWPEPLMRRQMPMMARDEPGPGSGLAATLVAVSAVLVIGLLLAGGYIAYREGWVDQLVAVAQPRPIIDAPQATGSPPPTEAATSGEPAATPSVPGAVPSPQATATVEPAASRASTEIVTTAGATPAPPSTLVDPAATEPTPAAVAVSEPATTTFDDPFAYCRSIGTIDYADSRYAGAPTVEAINRALSLPATAPRDRIHWRCVRGALLACTSYAGSICDMAPTAVEMRDFCQTNPNVGRLTAPSGTWSCADGKPQLPEDASWPVDERGFLPAAWIVVRPDATPAG